MVRQLISNKAATHKGPTTGTGKVHYWFLRLIVWVACDSPGIVLVDRGSPSSWGRAPFFGIVFLPRGQYLCLFVVRMSQDDVTNRIIYPQSLHIHTDTLQIHTYAHKVRYIIYFTVRITRSKRHSHRLPFSAIGEFRDGSPYNLGSLSPCLGLLCGVLFENGP